MLTTITALIALSAVIVYAWKHEALQNLQPIRIRVEDTPRRRRR